MKFISLVGKSASIFGLYAGLCLASNLAMASQNLSGAMIKAEIQIILGLTWHGHRPCDQSGSGNSCLVPQDLTIEPMFGSYKTVRVSCSDRMVFQLRFELKFKPTRLLLFWVVTLETHHSRQVRRQKLSSFRAACGAAKSSPMMIWS